MKGVKNNHFRTEIYGCKGSLRFISSYKKNGCRCKWRCSIYGVRGLWLLHHNFAVKVQRSTSLTDHLTATKDLQDLPSWSAPWETGIPSVTYCQETEMAFYPNRRFTWEKPCILHVVRSQFGNSVYLYMCKELIYCNAKNYLMHSVYPPVFISLCVVGMCNLLSFFLKICKICFEICVWNDPKLRIEEYNYESSKNV